MFGGAARDMVSVAADAVACAQDVARGTDGPGARRNYDNVKDVPFLIESPTWPLDRVVIAPPTIHDTRAVHESVFLFFFT